jgi:cyclophilin family peptidyl-prolyl cis-trans isomerase
MNGIRRMSIAALVVIIAPLAAGGVSAGNSAPVSVTYRQQAQTPQDICAQATQNIQQPATREFKQAEEVLKDDVDYAAVLCTATGSIYFDLLEAAAPITVNSFVFLAQQGYYNHTTFHRVLPGFMAQGGDFTGTGGGGPGYEFVNETSPDLVFDKAGIVAMANSGPDTNGSQFFITYGSASHLDGNYTIFGQVIEGMEAAELLHPRNPEQSPDFEGDALQTVVIVEDPAAVAATPDGPPSIDHLQALLNADVVSQITSAFQVVEEFSHTYDLEQEAQSFAPDGGDALVSFMRDYLTEKGFIGTAAALLVVAECPASPADLPVWALAFQVSDYGVDGVAEAVVKDDTRSDKLVESGAYDAYTDSATLPGRLYTAATPEGEWCGPQGTYYHFEMASGRYLVAADLILDDTVVSTTTTPGAEDYVGSVMQLMLETLGGVLERGNAASAAE